MTHPSHTTALQAPMWLVAKERAGTLVDLITSHRHSVPYTRVRLYGGTKSFIDRAYGSRLFKALYKTSGAQVPDFSGVTGIQDHSRPHGAMDTASAPRIALCHVEPP